MAWRGSNWCAKGKTDITITWFASAVRKSWKLRTVFPGNWRRKSPCAMASNPSRTSWSFLEFVPAASEASGANPDARIHWAAIPNGPQLSLLLWRSALGIRNPIAQFQVFLCFTAFVTVLFRFVWPVIDLREGVLGIANYVRDYVEGLRHGSDPLLFILETASSEKSANTVGNRRSFLF